MDPGNSGTLSQFRPAAVSNRVIFLHLSMPGIVCDRWDSRNLVFSHSSHRATEIAKYPARISQMSEGNRDEH
jgi:hypothetical protein